MAKPFVTVCVVVLLALVAACTRSPPEERLQHAVDSVVAAIEARDAGAVGEWISEDFIGPEQMDREGAMRLARLMFLRHRQVGVAVAPAQVELHGEHATVEVEAVMTGGAGGALPDAARVYRVRTGWRLEGGDWRMTSAEWTARL